MKKRQPKFDIVLAEAVQAGLNSIGPSISDAVLFYVEKSTATRPDCNAIDPEAFDECLRKIFGCGAEIMEKKILESLYLRLEIRGKIKDGFKFVDEVRKAEKFFDSLDLPIAEAPGETRGASRSTRRLLIANNKGQRY